MKAILSPISLFTLGETTGCIVVSYPKNGKIVDLFTADKEAIIIVQYEPDVEWESAHFHIIPLGQIIETEHFEYIGKFVFENIGGLSKLIAPVILITDGKYGSDTIKETDIKTNKTDITPDLIPLSKDEVYSLFDIKPKKRKYTRRRKDDGDR